MKTIRIQAIGGVNYNDPSEVLMAKAFDGDQQIAPLEWQAGHNLDFSRQLGRMRYGSTAKQSLASIMQAGETIICGGLFAENTTTNNQFEEIIVGSKSIYINRWSLAGNIPTQGTWAQITRNSQTATTNTHGTATGAAYTHNSTVSKASLTATDGHLMIQTDGANNPIQVYHTGTQLDDQLNGAYTSNAQTSNNVSGNSTGATIAITGNIANAQVGDRIHIHDSSHDEWTYITAITLNTSVTVSPTLSNTYTTTSNTGSTPATVVIENNYIQSFGGAAQSITGTWGAGYYMGMSMQGRYGFSKGDVQFEYSGATNPWDRFNGGVIACDGPIIAMEAFTPKFANLLGAVGVFHTAAEDAALQILSGFDPSSTMVTITGASPAMNYQSVCTTMNWVMYLTRNRRIEATDLTRVIDVGRRLTGQDSSSAGPLNTMNLTQALSTAFAFYDQKKRQAQFYFSDNNSTYNTDAMVVDMQLGEPTSLDNTYTDTGSYSFEKGIRMLYWVCSGEDSNTQWFTQMYQLPGSIRGIMPNGQLYQTEDPVANGYDFGTQPIQFDVLSPDFTAGLIGVQKKWRRLTMRTLTTSIGLLQVDIYVDRASFATAALEWTFSQLAMGLQALGSVATVSFTLGSSLLGGGGLVTGHSWLDFSSESVAFGLSLPSSRPTNVILSTIDIMYQQANLQD